MTDIMVRRSVALEDAPLEVARTADGRTLTGYVAVFDTPQPVADIHGQYIEVNARTAFNKTVADRGTRFLVTYNHGLTLAGTPSSEFSIPLGVPTAVRIDSRGVLADIRIDRTPLGDTVLEGARSGAIGGMSYQGRFIKSSPEKPRGGYRPDRAGELPTVTRHEIAMWEFGPTPIPAFDAAAIIGVRALVQSIEGLTADQRAELISLLQEGYELRSSTPSEPDGDGTPTGAALSEEPPAGALETPDAVPPAELIARSLRRINLT